MTFHLLAQFMTTWTPPEEQPAPWPIYIGFGVVFAVLLIAIVWVLYQTARTRRHHRRLLASIERRHGKPGGQKYRSRTPK